MTNLRIALTLIVAGAIGGCTKQMECSDTIDTINTAVTRLERLELSADSEDTEGVLRDAVALTKLAKTEAGNVRALKITDPELKGLVGRYVTMMEGMAAAGSDLESAVRKIVRLEAKTGDLAGDVEKAVEALGTACGKPAPGCKQLEAIIDKMPEEDLEDALFLEQLRASEKQLVAFVPKKPKVAAARKAFLEMTQGQLELLTEMTKAEKELEAAETAMDGATAVEDQLVDSLNSYCGGF